MTQTQKQKEKKKKEKIFLRKNLKILKKFPQFSLLGCYNKSPYTGCPTNNRTLFLTVLRVRV